VCAATRIAALLDGLTPAQLDLLPPVERRRFAVLCRRWHDLADRAASSAAPKVVFSPTCATATGRSELTAR
jgi:hypothetical protein